MSTVNRFIKTRAVPIYFALTLGISWGGVLLAVGAGGIPSTKEELATVLPFAISAMLVGPSAAGLLMIGLVNGRAGFRELLTRLLTWRVGLRWYAVALLGAPLLMTALLGALSLFSPVFVPGLFAADDKASRLLFGVTAGLAVGILEELGWTGFATPRLRRRHSILITGCILGVVWGAWHIAGPVVLATGTYTGALSLPLFVAARTVGLLAGALPAYRVLIVWVHDRTGSLLLAMLMHVSLTASTLTLEPLPISGGALLVYDLVSALAWWGLVALVLVATRGRQRLPIPDSRTFEEIANGAQFRDRVAVAVKASPEAIFDALRVVALGDMKLAWALGEIRYLPSRLRGRMPPVDSRRPFLSLLADGGTLILHDDSPHELVTGSAAALHRVHQAPRQFATREAFDVFVDPDYEKLFMSVRVAPTGRPDEYWLVLDHATRALSPMAARRFSLYWRLIKPLGAFVSWLLLRAIRRKAELAETATGGRPLLRTTPHSWSSWR